MIFLWLRAFSGLFLNLSSGWFGAVLILPGLSGKFFWLNLTANLFCAILSLMLHVLIERTIQNASR